MPNRPVFASQKPPNPVIPTKTSAKSSGTSKCVISAEIGGSGVWKLSKNDYKTGEKTKKCQIVPIFTPHKGPLPL